MKNEGCGFLFGCCSHRMMHEFGCGSTNEGHIRSGSQDFSCLLLYRALWLQRSNQQHTNLVWPTFCLGTGVPKHSAGGVGTFVRSYMVRIIRNVHARVTEAENSITFTVTGMELRTFCMVSVCCCTGCRSLLTCNPYTAHCLVLLYHSHIYLYLELSSSSSVSQF